jgi:hypothetical protein
MALDLRTAASGHASATHTVGRAAYSDAPLNEFFAVFQLFCEPDIKTFDGQGGFIL